MAALHCRAYLAGSPPAHPVGDLYSPKNEQHGSDVLYPIHAVLCEGSIDAGPNLQMAPGCRLLDVRHPGPCHQGDRRHLARFYLDL